MQRWVSLGNGTKETSLKSYSSERSGGGERYTHVKNKWKWSFWTSSLLPQPLHKHPCLLQKESNIQWWKEVTWGTLLIKKIRLAYKRQRIKTSKKKYWIYFLNKNGIERERISIIVPFYISLHIKRNIFHWFAPKICFNKKPIQFILVHKSNI